MIFAFVFAFERRDYLDTSTYAIYTWSLGEVSPLFFYLFPNKKTSVRSLAVTKKEIVKTISEEIGLTQLKTKEIVQLTFDAIVETLVDETKRQIDKGSDDGTLGRIELRNFGVFEVKKRAARKARNPRTGERVDVEEKFVVTFKPGKEMEEKVRQLQEYSQVRSAAIPATPGTTPGIGRVAPGSQMPDTYGTPQGYGNNLGGSQ